jgi:hypothetical protein
MKPVEKKQRGGFNNWFVFENQHLFPPAVQRLPVTGRIGVFNNYNSSRCPANRPMP